MRVDFELWDMSTIEDLLTRPEAAGLRSYWLGELELRSDWFRLAYKRTAIRLEERYQPEDHVEVEAEQTFGGLLRDDRFHRRLEEHLALLDANSLRNLEELEPEVVSGIQAVRVALESLPSASSIIPRNSATPIALPELQTRVQAIRLQTH
ncbi:hypothetical protein [Rhodobacter viridis]|uniref:hypothetical protein n=1 Tax=Rhodobacter viridis TaxID=1054202 RepID=UPI0011B751E4|nr:hypothetical protein [Rhodobacter viridis]